MRIFIIADISSNPIKMFLNQIPKLAKGFIRLIDNARLFISEDDYPTVEEMENVLLNSYSEWIFEEKDDIIRTYSNKLC